MGDKKTKQSPLKNAPLTNDPFILPEPGADTGGANREAAPRRDRRPERQQGPDAGDRAAVLQGQDQPDGVAKAEAGRGQGWEQDSSGDQGDAGGAAREVWKVPAADHESGDGALQGQVRTQ